ncbi:MAG: glycosyltransferase 87 family protein [Dehalococcoidales bacterium]|jgi:hypothetical protein
MENSLTPSNNAKKGFTFFPPDVTPRVTLFPFAIAIQLIACAISGVGFAANKAAFWLGGMVLWLLWFWVMFLIVTPETDMGVRRHYGGLRRGAMIILVIVLATGVGELFVLGLFAPGYTKSGASNDFSKSLEQMQHGFQYNDGTALSQQAAENLLDGQNPYAAANIVTAFIKYNGSYDRITPLQKGRLADVFPYPTPQQLKDVWNAALQHPSAPPPEIESHVCYPSGSFLLLTPFLSIGIKDIRWIYFIYIVAGLVYVAWRVPAGRRLFFIGIVLISLELWNSMSIGETGSLIFPFLLIAWITLGENDWLSAIFMGVAVATKQTAWFFLPFYLILIWRTSGARYAAAATGIIAAIFLAANGYFIVRDPALWLKSLTAPMAQPMFPIGVGLISFVTGGVLNVRSALPFTIMEVTAFAGAIVWYWKYCRRYPDTALVLAVLPFFFAWRSLWTYFFYITIIILARMLTRKSGAELPAPRFAGE